jgi:hypothetical protein
MAATSIGAELEIRLVLTLTSVAELAARTTPHDPHCDSIAALDLMRDAAHRTNNAFMSPASDLPFWLQQICAYLDSRGRGGNVQWVRYAMYRDQNGAPGQLVVATQGQYLEASQQAPNWVCQPIEGRWLQEPGSYWLMIHTGDLAGVVRYYYDGAANWFGNADDYDDGSADPFGAGGAGEGTISIRADYAPLRSAGATIIGTRVSSPMSANMKRGSSFTLTERAAVWQLNACHGSSTT